LWGLNKLEGINLKINATISLTTYGKTFKKYKKESYF
jgi:hypothetical protein